MRFTSGLLLLCLTVGCAAPSTAPLHTPPQQDHSTIAVPPADSLAIRVGVEYLPPSAGESPISSLFEVPEPSIEPADSEPEPSRSPRIEPAFSNGEEFGLRTRRAREDQVPWSMDREELGEISDPMERATLQLVQDLMGEDRRRIKRSLGTPILATNDHDLSSPILPTHLDEKQAEELDEFMTEHGGGLLRRPLRRLLRNLAVVQSFELAVRDFKGENVPLTDAYQTSHPRRRRWGRMSVRVHMRQLHNPVEMVYMNRGLRFGGSLDTLKAGYRTWLTDSLSVGISSRYAYDDPKWSVRGDLTCFLNHTTRLHVVAGDNLDFLATSNVYSLFDSPMDGSPGILFYAVHLF